MHRHLLSLVVILSVLPACKSMGGMMSGLGKVAAGAAHVGGAVAKGVAHAGGAVASGVVHATPSMLRATEAIAEAAIMMTPDVVVIAPAEAAAPAAVTSSDPCIACPLDADCGMCVGYAGYACVTSPAGALGRCESSAPPDAEPAETASPSSF
jgi:hypothetical protein